MSLQPQETYTIPDETARVARAIFPTGNLAMRIADELRRIVGDRDFADLFPVRGRPAEAPGRLALVTLLQFMEGLTDRQATDAVRTRIDWKYLLALDLTDVGFDHTVLSEFRTRLLMHGAERRLFDATLDAARAQGVLTAGGRQRSDSTHVLGAMRTMNRLEAVNETLRAALNALATAAPEWLRARTTPDWVDRYGLHASEFRLPKGDAARRAWATRTGLDGMQLFKALDEEGTPSVLRGLLAVETLRQVWVQNFLVEHLPEGPRLAWRGNDNVPRRGSTSARPTTPRRAMRSKGRRCGRATRST